MIPSIYREKEREMYVDLTTEFRLLVSSLASRAGELGISVATKDKNRILGEKVGDVLLNISASYLEIFQGGLRKQAEKIVQTVVSLAELLKEHRSRYLDNHTFAGGGAMTETERNQVRRRGNVDNLIPPLRLMPGLTRLPGSVAS